MESRKLNTIKDFDFGADFNSGNGRVNRVPNIPPRTDCGDMRFLIWLMLEKEFYRQKKSETETNIPVVDGSFHEGTDEVDARIASSSSHRNIVVTKGGRGGLTQRVLPEWKKRPKTQQFAEQLLINLGVDTFYDNLTPTECNSLFRHFKSQSDLLQGEAFNTMFELHNSLRRRSRFREQFFIVSQIGRGAFGEVFGVRRKNSCERFAVKKMALTLDNYENIKMSLNEFDILKRLRGNHPTIVQYYDSWLELDYEDSDDGDDHDGVGQSDRDQILDSGFGNDTDAVFGDRPLKFYLQMELCGQSLEEWRNCNLIIENGKIVNIYQQLADGLSFLHEHDILHLDINPKNILWSNARENMIRITDFGLAIQGKSTSERSGTVPYLAPEEVLTAKSDVYSMGATLFFLSQHFKTQSEFIHKLQTGTIATSFPILNSVLPDLIVQDPTKRLSSLDVKRRAFFFGYSSLLGFCN